MNIRKVLRYSIRGVPVLPLLLMSVITVAAITLAITSINTSVTIVSSAGTLTLYTDPGGLSSTGHACGSTGTSGVSATTLTFPSVFSGVVNVIRSNTTMGSAAVAPPGYFNTNLGFFCFFNGDGTNVYINPTSWSLTGSFPAGTTIQVYSDFGVTGLGAGSGTRVDTGTFCIPVGAYRLTSSSDCSTTVSMIPNEIELHIPSTATPGTYSFSVQVTFYSTASG